MARIRSPNYPAISLSEAIKRIETVHAREHQHPAAREVVVKGMGYSGIHGTSLGALSAAVKFGLLETEGKGEDYRVTDRAVAILHPHNPAEKAEALRAAARSPALFSELLEHFKGQLPSDDNLRAYLIRRGFTQSSLPAVIQAFRDTMELVTLDNSGYPEKERSQEATPLRANLLSVAPPELATPNLGSTSIEIEDARVVVSATLLWAESVQKLIDKLSAIKSLLPNEPRSNEGAAKPNRRSPEDAYVEHHELPDHQK